MDRAVESLREFGVWGRVQNLQLPLPHQPCMILQTLALIIRRAGGDGVCVACMSGYWTRRAGRKRCEDNSGNSLNCSPNRPIFQTPQPSPRSSRAWTGVQPQTGGFGGYMTPTSMNQSDPLMH